MVGHPASHNIAARGRRLAYINKRHGCNNCSTRVPTFVAGHHRYRHDMKSIYILAAIILVFSDSVLTDDMADRNSETELGLQAIDLIQHPDMLFDAETAFELMDKLCGQVVDGMQGIVSGALNVDTGEFKTWAEYTATEGQNPNQGFYFATERWATFRGECMLRPHSTWWEHGPKSFGTWVENTATRRDNRRSRINVRFEGFTTSTSMPSWATKCKNPNVDAMVTLFRTMPGIPDNLITVWDGLDRKYEDNRMTLVSIRLSPGEEGRAIATTALRVVHAVQVFRVDEWYWHYNDLDRGFATSWQKLGLGWKYVYSDLAFVEARGLSQLFPRDRSHVRGSRPINPDTCVNLDNRDIVSLDRVGNAVLVEAAIDRSEL
jgi:hypothetical protein